MDKLISLANSCSRYPNGMNDEELNKPVVHKILFYLICKYRTHKNVID